jgi:TolA-binding protein
VTRVGQSVAVFLGIGEPQHKPQGPAAPAAAPPEPTVAKTPAAPSIVVPVPSTAPEKSARSAAGAKAPSALAHKAAAASGEASGAQALFAEANQARRRGDLAKAGGLYRDLQQRFPGSQEAALSQVTLSMLLLDRGDAAGALAGFDKYLARSRRPLEAEAMVGRARALGALGSRSAESLAWQKVQRKYPGSVYARQASDRLAALGSP